MKWIVLRLLLLAVVSAAFLGLTCRGGEDPDPAPGTGTSGEAALTGSITVFAAASLTDAFSEIAAEFEKANPGVEVSFNFAGSPTLRTQLEQGARADVYASADVAQMNQAKESRVVEQASSVFARNSLVVITPRSNPGGINALADLRKEGLKLVLAAQEVPVGAYSRQVLERLEADPTLGPEFSEAVLRNLVSNEANVKQVVAKVELGEADAGIVYGTDVTPSVTSALNTIEIPAQYNITAEYPIALTADSRNERVASAFIAFVLSAEGQAVLQKWGFLPK